MRTLDIAYSEALAFLGTLPESRVARLCIAHSQLEPATAHISMRVFPGDPKPAIGGVFGVDQPKFWAADIQHKASVVVAIDQLMEKVKCYLNPKTPPIDSTTETDIFS